MGVSFQDPKYPVGSVAPTQFQHRSGSRAQWEPARNAVLLIIQRSCAIERYPQGPELPATTGGMVWPEAWMWRVSVLRGACT
jgi:hypothetical protein